MDEKTDKIPSLEAQSTTGAVNGRSVEHDVSESFKQSTDATTEELFK